MFEYRDTFQLLSFICFGHNRLLFFKNSSDYLIYDNKRIIFLDRFEKQRKNQTYIEFHPLNEQEQSCSHLLIVDAIHLYLKNLIQSLFNKILKVKDGTITHKFDKAQIDSQPNTTKITIHKFNYLFDAVSSISFSRELITFSIDFNSTSNRANIDFRHPLYDELCTLRNNTLFGIYLEDFEIGLFKKIYEDYIIELIDNLFQKDIEVPQNSNQYPHYYTLLTIKVMIEEAYWKKYYKITILTIINTMLKEYKEILANLNQLTYKLPSISKEQKELDLQSYKNEVAKRKETESNWLKLKDKKMQEVVKKQGTEIITSRDKEIAIFAKYAEAAEEKYVRQINNFLTKLHKDDLTQDYNRFKNDQEWAEIFHWENLVLNILNANGTSLWFDTRIDKYCFRSKVGANLVYKNKEGISELLTRALKEKITDYLKSFNNGFFTNHAIEIVLVHKLNGIQSQKLKQSERASNVIKMLLFENEIRTIDDDKFDVNFSIEFFKDDNDFFYTRNRFIPTKYLLKYIHSRFPLLNKNIINLNSLFTRNEDSYLLETLKDTSNCRRSSFIEDFIYYLVDEDVHSYYYVMNWLSCFFNHLEKSDTALVLLGDQETTQNILWDKIIKEIFGLQYCISINDEECSTSSTFDIAKDKLFFHIGDINNPATKFDDETLYKLVKDLLVKKSVTRLNEEDEQEESIIHGQMIITAKNPAPYIKRALSKCSIIKVNDMDTIIEKLGVPDELILEDRIQKDLDNFSDILNSFQYDYELTKYAMDTKYRKEISDNKTSNINKEDIDNKIDAFIQAIKDKNIEYFEKVKEIEDGVIYEHLKNAFNKDDGYFIGQNLYLYYNAIHKQSFKKNKPLMDKLKQKDEMFSQEINTLKIRIEDKEKVLFKAYQSTADTDRKKLYKINDYTLAKDITIPSGAIIISSQDNIQKYNHPDLENAIKIHKEYIEKKAKAKAKK